MTEQRKNWVDLGVICAAITLALFLLGMHPLYASLAGLALSGLVAKKVRE